MTLKKLTLMGLPQKKQQRFFDAKEKYIAYGGARGGGKSWALADSMLMPEILKLVYITEPTVLLSTQTNPLLTDYIGYVDFGFGFGDARPIIFSDPA